MTKVTIIYDVKVPVTHNQGEQRGEWSIKVIKVGRTFKVVTEEYYFCHMDNAIIKTIFKPYEQDLVDMFYGFFEKKSVTRKAEYYNAAGINSVITGIKNKDTAIQLGKWLEAVASNALKNVPSDELDRDIYLNDVKLKAIDTIKQHSDKFKRYDKQ